jgi:hypothetical protein
MCPKAVSEKGLAHISECPLPDGGTATTTTFVQFFVGFTNASDPLVDGILARNRPNSLL